MADGLCPFAVWRPTKNFGYPAGRHGQNRPLFFADHIMGGFKSTMDNRTWLDNSGISSHFGIGKDGSISQYVNILDASYANGVSGRLASDVGRPARYDRTNRHLAALEQGNVWQPITLNGVPYWTLTGDVGGPLGSILNARSITTEHEGLSGRDPWTPAMLDADIRVKRWCCAELALAGLPFTTDFDSLVSHSQIDPVNRPECPGPAWPKARILAALTAKEEDEPMNRWQGLANPGYFANRKIDGPKIQDVWARQDFGLPASARSIELVIYLKEGGLDILDGNTGKKAGYCPAGVSHYRVFMDPTEKGLIGLKGYGAVLDKIECVGFWS